MMEIQKNRYIIFDLFLTVIYMRRENRMMYYNYLVPETGVFIRLYTYTWVFLSNIESSFVEDDF